MEIIFNGEIYQGENSMLNKKGQGLTEYGIIFLLIVGTGFLAVFYINNNETGIYSAVSSKLQAITGNNENYDTDETTIVAGQKVTFTTLTVQGKDRTYRVAWFLDDKGQRVYFPYRDTNGLHDTSDLQGIHWGHDYTVEHESDGGMSTYFRSTDGAYYKITDYSNSETKISKYEGIPDSRYLRTP